MPVSLSVKHVPDDVARGLRARAKENHRSLQGELLAILEAAAYQRRISPEEVYRRVRALGTQQLSFDERLQNQPESRRLRP